MPRHDSSIARVLVAFALTALAGCASGPPPRVVRAAELATAPPLEPGQSLVIELQPGDEIPLEVSVEGPLVESPKTAAPIRLKVVRHFFLRIDEDGVATSLDGKSFGSHAEPGAFRFGVGATKAAGIAATMAIRTPTPEQPGG